MLGRSPNCFVLGQRLFQSVNMTVLLRQRLLI
jgi:hypothetical protein